MRKRYLEDYPDVLKPNEAQEVLGIGRNAIYDLLKNGTLPSIRIGKLYRIPKKALQNYIEMCYNNISANSCPKLQAKKGA